MAITGFQIRRLTLVGRGVPNAEAQFREGLNVVSGPSDTGKTFIVQCIDYMLGGKDVPESIPEAAQYETVRLALNVSGGDGEVVLERSIRGGDFKLISPGKADQHLSAKHSAGDTHSVSQYLLGLAALTGKKVRKNKQGATREVSFRDLARLILVDEEAIISKTSPILTGQYTTSTAESAVFRLLLTGVDDSSLISSEDPKVAKGRQAGKVEMLDLLLNQTKARMAEMQLPGDVQDWQGQLVQIEALFEAAQKELAVEQQNAAQLEGKRRTELSSLRKLESRLGVLRELQRRFALLEQQYLSDQGSLGMSFADLRRVHRRVPFPSDGFKAAQGGQSLLSPLLHFDGGLLRLLLGFALFAGVHALHDQLAAFVGLAACQCQAGVWVGAQAQGIAFAPKAVVQSPAV